MRKSPLRTKIPNEYNGIKIIKDLGMGNFNGTKKRERWVSCLCECGNTFSCRWDSVKTKNTTGCKECRNKKIKIARTSHGDSKRTSPYYYLYEKWQGMKARCYDKNNERYSTYGKVGVSVCKEWVNSYENFKDWALANGASQDMQLDKDILSEKMGIKNKIYSPDTCCFISQIANSQSNYRGQVKAEFGYKNVYKRGDTYYGQKNL